MAKTVRKNTLTSSKVRISDAYEMFFYNCAFHGVSANAINCMPEKHVKFAEELARRRFPPSGTAKGPAP